MKFVYLFTTLILIISVILIIPACSSSSGSIRYGNSQNDGKTSDNDATGISKNNQSVKDDSIDFDDDEFPESEDPSDLPEDEASLNLTEIIKKIEDSSNKTDLDAAATSKRDLILMEIIKYLNTPYKYGGNSMDGIDCSAFTQSVYHNTDFYDLNRSARDQYQQGIEVKDRSELKFGDLVFFNTRRRVKPGHVGIYIGDNLFAHASSKVGVTISSLDHEYYSKRYMGARRYDFDNELKK
jgi:cell wall-associated NlpC family hydrolase